MPDNRHSSPEPDIRHPGPVPGTAQPPLVPGTRHAQPEPDVAHAPPMLDVAHFPPVPGTRHVQPVPDAAHRPPPGTQHPQSAPDVAHPPPVTGTHHPQPVPGTHHPQPARDIPHPQKPEPVTPAAQPAPGIRHTPEAPTRTQALAPGERIDAHRHDDHQIIYAGSGVVAVTTGAGTWFAPGTRALWVPAGCVHAHRAHGHLALHLLGLPATTNPLGLDAPTVLTVGPLLRELILACTREPHEDTPERRRLRAVLLDQLRASPQQPVQLPTPSDPRLATVCDLLRDDPADPRGLAELAAAAGAGERTLSRLFRRELGMTFPQWRTQLRLYHALRMLADGLPVTTVAHRCGWSSTSAFIDVFRRAYGYTPGTHNRRD